MQDAADNQRPPTKTNRFTVLWLATCLVSGFGCWASVPKSDICGSEKPWSEIQQEKLHPAKHIQTVEDECSLDKCRPRQYNGTCKALIELSDMSLTKPGVPVEEQLANHIQNQSAVLAKHVANRWRVAIEQDLFIGKYLGFLTIRAEELWKEPSKAELDAIKEQIKQIPDGERRDWLIELYAVAEQYHELAFNQEGHSLESYRDKIDKMDSQAAPLIAKLEFAK